MSGDVMLAFGAVGDRHNRDWIAEVQQQLHDRIIDQAGSARRSGVSWTHYDAQMPTEPLLKFGVDPGLVAFLEANPDGLLVIAQCEVAKMA